MFGAYRRWRYTRFVTRWRTFIVEQRAWDRVVVKAIPGLTGARHERYDKIADALREVIADEPRRRDL